MKVKTNLIFILTLLIITYLFGHTALAVQSSAVQSSLSWDTPTRRENGVELKPGELASIELQYVLIPLDIHTEGVWDDSITLTPYTIEYASPEIEITEGFIGVQWRIRVVDSNGVFSAWSDTVKIIPYSPIRKITLIVVNNQGSITINIDSNHVVPD